jgi:hypothetical protein
MADPRAPRSLLDLPPVGGGLALAVEESQRYSVLSLLGVGAMGRVLRMWDERLGREVARKEPTEAGPAADRLRREILALLRLRHPAIPEVLDAGQDGLPWFTMPVFDGPNLADDLREHPKMRERHLHTVLIVAEALGHAHVRGVIHRDVKAEHVLLCDDGPRLIDWGLSQILSKEGEPARPGESRPGGVLGTPANMAPEQAAGAQVGPPADVWALGVLLVQVLTGRGLHAGFSEMEILQRLVAGRVPIPEVPVRFAPLVADALCIGPDNRIADAAVFAGRLRQILVQPLAARWGRVGASLLPIGLMVGLALGLYLGQFDPRRPPPALRESLLAQAQAAAQDGARAEAELLAAEVLAVDDSEEARSILSMWSRSPRPRMVWDTPVPPCAWPEVSPLGTQILCLEADTLVMNRVDPQNGTLAEDWHQPVAVMDAAFSGDGQRLLVMLKADQRRVVLDAATGGLLAQVSTIRGRSAQIHSVDPNFAGHFSPHGVFIVDLATGLEEELRFPEGDPQHRIVVAALGPQGQLALGRADGSLLIRPVGGESFEEVGKMDAEPYVLRFGPDGHSLGVGTVDGRVVVLDNGSRKRAIEAKLGQSLVRDLAFSTENAGRIAVVMEDGGTFLVEAGTVFPLPRSHDRSVRFGAAGRLLGMGRHLRMWEIPEQFRPEKLVAGDGVASLDVHGPSGRLGVGLASGEAWEWSLDAASPVIRLSVPGGGVVKDLAFSGVGDAAAVGGVLSDGVFVWVGREVGDLVGSNPFVTRAKGGGEPCGVSGLRRVGRLGTGDFWALPYGAGPILCRRTGQSWTLDRSLLVPGAVLSEGESNAQGTQAIFVDDRDDMLFRLDALPEPHLRRIGRWPEPLAVDISADGAFVVVADAAGLVVVDGQTAAVRKRLSFDGVERITDIAISPDDRLIAAGDLGGRVVVFDLPTGRRLGTLRGHSERIAALEFASPNLLVSGSWDDSVRLWDLDVLSAERSALVAELRETWGVPISEVLGGR